MIGPAGSQSAETVISDFACLQCGCDCDDLQVRVHEGKLLDIAGACPLATAWLDQLNREPLSSLTTPRSDWRAVIRDAASVLRNSRYPLIYGMSYTGIETQRAAIELAEVLRATIDTTASDGHGASVRALQTVGESTCSLGEARLRADLVIYWGCDPTSTHPRHLERYVRPTRPGVAGPANRRVLLVDVGDTVNQTAAHCDQTVHIPRSQQMASLIALRCLVGGRELPAELADTLPLSAVQDLAVALQKCQFGIVYFGYGLIHEPLGHRHVEQLLRLVTDLNRGRRFYARRLRGPGNVAGADSVLCWQSGYPFAVDYSRGYPRYNPEEYAAGSLLARGEADAVILVGSRCADVLPAAARQRLNDLPVLALDPLGDPIPGPDQSGRALAPRWQLRTATAGVHYPTNIYRMDEVPIRMRSALSTDLPTEAEILQQLKADILAG